MISQRTIDSVFAAVKIEQIVGEFVELKKSGSSYVGLSPFGKEKTPSFYVVPSKEIFKDFSSGKGGSVITFLMELKGLSYPECIEYLADYYQIPVEREQQTQEQQRQATEKTSLKKILKSIQRKYVQLRMEEQKTNDKMAAQADRFSDDSLLQWQVGYAPDDSKYLYSICQEKGIVQLAEQAGVLTFKQGQYYDFYRYRLIFPIHNTKGEVVSFGGRALQKDAKPKYINGRDTAVFNKSNVLYGAHFATRKIRNTEKAYLAEGYADVIAMHKVSMENTVATCGTALSEAQLKWLARHAQIVVILRDGDAAGVKAAKADMEKILEAGLEARYVALPDGKDPWDLCHAVDIDDPAIWMEENEVDALLHFSKSVYGVASSPKEKATALDTITGWIGLITDDFVREQYRKELAKVLKVKAADLKQREEEQKELRVSFNSKRSRTYDFQEKLPDKVSTDDILRDNFYGIVNGDETGYYFLTKNWQDFQKVSNFVIEPLFHKYEREDNTRVIRVQNGIGPPEILELPSSAMIGVTEFQKFMFDKGSYLWQGDRIQLGKLNKKYLFEFPKAFELKTLGWQMEGFFAFYNCVYNGTLKQYNEAGLIEHDKQFYFSPAASQIYSDTRQDDDLFRNDRYLEYTDSPISLEEWMKLMVQVYGEHAYAGIPFALVSLFRDIVFRVDNNCPFLYNYGQSKSGKSKFAESVLALFFKEMPAFNLNSGTDFAFASRMERYRNVPVFFNEFDDTTLMRRKPEWFQALKGAYDGEGRERGLMGSRKKTEIQQVNCSIMLVGQYMSTQDDNSILSRSIMRSFKIEYNRTEEQIQAYNKLKGYEGQGITSLITKLMPHRQRIEKDYYGHFNELMKLLGKQIRQTNNQPDERVLRNYTAMATLYDLFREHFRFPWDREEYMAWIRSEIVQMSSLLKTTDILVDFWVTINTLADMRQVMTDTHFKVMERTDIRVTVDGEDKTINLGETKKVLYIKLREVQKIYAMQKRKEGGNPIDWTSLQSYLQSRDYSLGWIKRERIGRKLTSAFLFDYDALDLSLEQEPETEAVPLPNSDTPPLPDEDLPF